MCWCRAPNGIRTRASALKGRRPRPLDDGGPAPRHLPIGDSPESIARAFRPPGRERRSGRAAVADQIDRGTVRFDRGLEFLASRLRLGRRILESVQPELLQDLRRTGESRIPDLAHEVE